MNSIELLLLDLYYVLKNWIIKGKFCVFSSLRDVRKVFYEGFVKSVLILSLRFVSIKVLGTF